MNIRLDSRNNLINYIEDNGKNALLVCGKSFFEQELYHYLVDKLNELEIKVICFTDFQINPTINNVTEGIRVFNDNKCDFVLGVGGGSALDVAKAICAYYPFGYNWWGQTLWETKRTKMLAIPTTAGTGSESTQFSILYKDGSKVSLDNQLLMPDAFYLEGMLLESLPMYQKKATLLDAFSHAIESYWAVAATAESRADALKAIDLIVNEFDSYMDGAKEANLSMLEASNFAGKAINITHTTVAHAMSYRLTTKYGYSHGHAVALCLQALWRLVRNNYNESFFISEEQKLQFEGAINKLRPAMEWFDLQFNMMRFERPVLDEEALNDLVESVNTARLGNFPLKLTEIDIREMYKCDYFNSEFNCIHRDMA